MVIYVWFDWKCWCECDWQFVVVFNYVVGDVLVMCFYCGVSCFGDGMFWYVLMVVLFVVGGDIGWECVKQMGLMGLFLLVIYILFKCGVCWFWFYFLCEEIYLCGCVFDQFSFLLGYMLYVVLFSIVMVVYYLCMVLVFVLFMFMVVVFCVVFGLYYLSDVLVGVGFGMLIGGLLVWLFQCLCLI